MLHEREILPLQGTQKPPTVEDMHFSAPLLLSLFYGASTLASPILQKRHTTMQYVWVNGVDLGAAGREAVRDPGTNAPVTNVNDAAIACNLKGNTGVSGIITARAGDTITTEYHHDNNNRGSEFVDPSHKGPYSVYIGKVSSATTSSASGISWAKIYQDGYTPSDKKWATDRMNANGGKATFKLPGSLASGDYLLRTEFIALQGAGVTGGAQFYTGCVQMRITGTGGSKVPADAPGVSMPGYHKADHPGVLFRLDTVKGDSYTIPGPPVWQG